MKESITYKGYNIKISPNGIGYTCLIYKEEVFIAGTFAIPTLEEPDAQLLAVSKAMNKVDFILKHKS